MQTCAPPGCADSTTMRTPPCDEAELTLAQPCIPQGSADSTMRTPPWDKAELTLAQLFGGLVAVSRQRSTAMWFGSLQAPGTAAAKGPATGTGPGWSFPPFSSTPLSGTSGFGTHQNFLQPPSAPPLQQQQVLAVSSPPAGILPGPQEVVPHSPVVS